PIMADLVTSTVHTVSILPPTLLASTAYAPGNAMSIDSRCSWRDPHSMPFPTLMGPFCRTHSFSDASIAVHAASTILRRTRKDAACSASWMYVLIGCPPGMAAAEEMASSAVCVAGQTETTGQYMPVQCGPGRGVASAREDATARRSC